MKHIIRFVMVVLAALLFLAPRAALAFSPTQTDYTWSTGHAPTHMQSASTSFCVLHEIIGKFATSADYVQIDTASDGNWEVYGGGNIQNVKATCVNSNAAEVQNGVSEYWLESSLPIPTTHTLPGSLTFQNLTGDFCFLMAVDGGFGFGVDGFASHVDVYQTSPGQWIEDAEGDITQTTVEAGCVNMSPQVPLVELGGFVSTGGVNNNQTPPPYPAYMCGLSTVQLTWSSTQSFGQIVVNPSRGTQTLQTSSPFFGDASIGAECLFLTPLQ